MKFRINFSHQPWPESTQIIVAKTETLVSGLFVITGMLVCWNILCFCNSNFSLSLDLAFDCFQHCFTPSKNLTFLTLFWGRGGCILAYLSSLALINNFDGNCYLIRISLILSTKSAKELCLSNPGYKLVICHFIIGGHSAYLLI